MPTANGAPSSSGQDTGFSTQKPEFDSPWRYHLKKFLVPGILILTTLLIAGGFYFRQRGLSSIPQPTTPTGEEGEISGARTGLPQNFPNDVPLFEPAEILSSLESKERIQVTLQTEAASERVQRFYQQEMKGLGWRLTGRGMANENGVLTFVKDDRTTQVVITADSTALTLIILGTSSNL